MRETAFEIKLSISMYQFLRNHQVNFEFWFQVARDGEVSTLELFACVVSYNSFGSLRDNLTSLF